MTDFSLEKIEQYLKGRLEGPDRIAFERRLETDTGFKQLVEDHRVIFAGLKGIEIETFKNKVEGWETEIQQTEYRDSPEVSTPLTSTPPIATAVNRSFNWRIFAAAASIMFLLAAGTYVWASQSYGSETLAISQYEAPILPVDRSGSTIENEMSDGVQAMKRGDYPTAIISFKNIPPSAPEYVEAQFFLGHSLYNNGQLADAVSAFQKVIASKDPRFAPDAEWTAALSHLKNKNPKSALVILQDVINTPGHGYRDRALDLKKEVSSFWFGLVN